MKADRINCLCARGNPFLTSFCMSKSINSKPKTPKKQNHKKTQLKPNKNPQNPIKNHHHQKKSPKPHNSNKKPQTKTKPKILTSPTQNYKQKTRDPECFTKRIIRLFPHFENDLGGSEIHFIPKYDTDLLKLPFQRF